MSEILAWFNPYRWIALAVLLAALVVGYFGWQHHEQGIGEARGRAAVQAKWDLATAQQVKADFIASEHNAAETARRGEAQQANQEKQNAELALARAAADRNARDAERVRKQAATAADLWSHTLRNSPTAADLSAAADTIVLQANVLGRADRRAGELASYGDAARAAGLKCERDYDALTP